MRRGAQCKRYKEDETLACKANLPASFGPKGNTSPRAAAVLAVPLLALRIIMVLGMIAWMSPLACLWAGTVLSTSRARLWLARETLANCDATTLGRLGPLE